MPVSPPRLSTSDDTRSLPVNRTFSLCIIASLAGTALLLGMSPSPVRGGALSAATTDVTAPLTAHVTEFPLAWPKGSASTHELTYNRNGGSVFWVTGQNHDALARVSLDGVPTFFALPSGSGPHGIQFDSAGNLWVTLEYSGQVAQIDQNTGTILKTIDVSLHATGAPLPINTHPHGLGVAPDGRTLWFTGKATGTVGRITPDGTVTHFALPTVGSVPIYITAGPDGNMWCTELVGNQIARITPDGIVTEYPIPTYNSRPIGVTPGPDGRSMWFSEEAGNKIGRIDTITGALTEFPVPMLHASTILASLAFDAVGNLWTQAYVNPNNAYPAGADAVVKIDASIVAVPGSGPSNAQVGDLSSVPITFYEVPTLDTVMHRITQGPDGAIWFTELHADQLGRLEFLAPAEAAKQPRPLLKKDIAPPTPRKIRPKPEVCG
jgi:virginiamycin B lyase